MKMKSFFYLVILIPIISCNTTEPLKQDEHPVLNWEVDTIAYPGSFQTSMNTIWGNSTTDLWIAGHNNRGYGKAFHYDGNEWKDFLPIQPNIIDSYSFNTSLNLNVEVFLCGDAISFINDTALSDSSLILLYIYGENQWSISQLGGGGAILSISGNKNGKLYAAGWDLTLFSYENNNWVRKIIDPGVPKEYETKSINSVLVDQNQNGYMFVYCYNQDPYGSYNYFVRESGNDWIKVDSFDTDLSSKWGLNFWESQDGNIYSYNPGIYKYIGNSWVNIFNNSQLVTTIKGTSSNNIFAAGHGLYHFNGKEWFEYKELYNKYGLARDILMLEDHIFVLFSSSSHSFVLKGHK